MRVIIHFCPLPGETKGQVACLQMEPNDVERLKKDLIETRQTGVPSTREYKHSEGSLVVSLGHIHFIE